MGWTIVALSLLLILSVASFFHERRKKTRKRLTDHPELEENLRSACMQNEENVGEFEISPTALTDTSWLGDADADLQDPSTRAVVKWRNKGNQCLYRIIVTAGDGDEPVSHTSETFKVDL